MVRSTRIAAYFSEESDLTVEKTGKHFRDAMLGLVWQIKEIYAISQVNIRYFIFQ